MSCILEKIIMVEIMVDYCHICRNVNISTTTVPMTTKLGRLVIYYEELLLIKPHDSLIMWSSKITWQTKTVISPLSPCLATNLDWMVTYCFDINRRLLAIKSYEPLIAWSCKIMWQTKIIISPLPQWIWQSNWVQWWFTLRGSYQCYSIWLFCQLVLWDPMTN